MTEDQYRNIRGQIWTVLGITVIGFAITFLRIESVRCHCNGFRVETSGNRIDVHPSDHDAEMAKLVREQLVKKGLIDGNVLGTGSSTQHP